MDDHATYIEKRIPRRKRMIKRSRTIPVPGQPIEAYQGEKLYKCWYCGTTNTTGRDEEDTGNSHMSSSYSMPRHLSIAPRGGEDSVKSINRSLCGVKVAPVAGADGTARVVKNEWTLDSHRGCKSCGTINWIGRH